MPSAVPEPSLWPRVTCSPCLLSLLSGKVSQTRLVFDHCGCSEEYQFYVQLNLGLSDISPMISLGLWLLERKTTDVK